jgi:hypothetical protein
MFKKIPNSVKAVAQRMVRAFASTVLATSIIGGGFNAFGSVDWTNVLGVGVGAAVVSLLMSLAGQATSGNGPAFGSVEQVKSD